jgi:hypothetical protein
METRSVLKVSDAMTDTRSVLNNPPVEFQYSKGVSCDHLCLLETSNTEIATERRISGNKG